jgi:hypothetical protein
MDLATRKSWLERLNDVVQAEVSARAEDPWKLRLERVKGKIDFADQLERVGTQQLFDLLEVPRAGRTSGACRRISAIMTELGWSPTMARGLTPGFRDRTRGYCRNPRQSGL